MFSGQGSQKLGMCKDIYDNFYAFRQTVEEASDALGFDVAKLCFEDGEALSKTEYAQPALVTMGIASYRLLEKEGFKSKFFMGLSLGEYTALVAAGIMDFSKTLQLVHKRGLLMNQHAKAGSMAAVMADVDVVEDIVKANQTHGTLVCANYNTPMQTVISGEKAAVDAALAQIKGMKEAKAVPLKVAGPFHSPLMVEAAIRLKEEIEGVVPAGFVAGPVISNVDAEVLATGDLKQQLFDHMVGPVHFWQSLRKVKDLGIRRAMELGSGDTLVKFVQKTYDYMDAFSIETAFDLEDKMKIVI